MQDSLEGSHFAGTLVNIALNSSPSLPYLFKFSGIGSYVPICLHTQPQLVSGDLRNQLSLGACKGEYGCEVLDLITTVAAYSDENSSPGRSPC